MDTTDLLFAHAVMCDYAQKHTWYREQEPKRLVEVINSFQNHLKDHLISDDTPFRAVFSEKENKWSVEPVGGWL